MKDPRMYRRGSGFARRMNRRVDAAFRPVVDMVDATGRASVACPVPMLGGTEQSHAYFPPANNTDSPVVFSEGAFSQMVPVSAAAWPAEPGAYKKFVSEAPEVADDEDYPDVNTAHEPVFRHNGVRIQVTEDGQLVISSENQVRIQIVQGSELRVSLSETPTESRLALAGPVNDQLEHLADKIVELNDRLNQLMAGLALETVPTVTAGLTATKAAIADILKTPLLDVSPEGEDAISSSAFLVSSQTVADVAFLSSDEA